MLFFHTVFNSISAGTTQDACQGKFIDAKMKTAVDMLLWGHFKA